MSDDARDDRRGGEGRRACPVCNKPVTREEDPYPFCSKRCRLVDLGEWFDGSYRVTRPVGDQDF